MQCVHSRRAVSLDLLRMRVGLFLLLSTLLVEPDRQTVEDVEVNVTNTDEFRRAVLEVRAGSTILIAPGSYPGGLTIRGIVGEPGRPIRFRAADPANPPVFQGGLFGIHLSEVSHVELLDLVFERATDNGINIDDGWILAKPSHHVVLKRLIVRDTGPSGNRDGIKLSGLDDFRVEDCTVERWGNGGSGLDMVGCHRVSSKL
ncbi:hypothetical protein P12x_004271 [Tundrisphaera lichenicola]|uniref:hypothetical protein n=1 Tax=Tundrisphaera lichenicola TaxID=2029860 RepID=UPI003EBA9C60